MNVEFELHGRTEKVKALSNVNLNETSDYYPIKKYGILRILCEN